MHPKVYADFHNADSQGRVRLNCAGTIQELNRLGLQLHDGLHLLLYSDDADDQGRPRELQVEGRVEHSPEEQCWVAVIDWDAIHPAPVANGSELTSLERRTSP